MKFLPLIAVSCAALVSQPALVSAAESKSAYVVQVRTVKLRSEPKPWSAGKLTLQFGDHVAIVSSSDGWAKVRARSGVEGYLHESALTTRSLALKGTSQGERGTSDSDIVLAGKGFDKSLEKALAESDTSLDFRGVDTLEKQRVSDGDLASFLKQGKLGGY